MKLYNGDCLEVMDRLIEEGVKVDLVLTDLPQGITKNKWDNIIPLNKMWCYLNSLTKVTTPIILFSNQPFSSKLICSNFENYRFILYWQKNRPTGFLNAKKMPLKDIEEIIIFYKKQPTYNPQMSIGKPNHSNGNIRKKSTNNNYNNYTPIKTKKNCMKYPRQLLSYNRPHPPLHPTQKPVELLEYLIKTYTNEGDTVLDFTMGSGSTGVACQNLNRHFIGIELDEKYFEIAKERLNKNI